MCLNLSRASVTKGVVVLIRAAPPPAHRLATSALSNRRLTHLPHPDVDGLAADRPVGPAGDLPLACLVGEAVADVKLHGKDGVRRLFRSLLLRLLVGLPWRQEGLVRLGTVRVENERRTSLRELAGQQRLLAGGAD